MVGFRSHHVANVRDGIRPLASETNRGAFPELDNRLRWVGIGRVDVPELLMCGTGTLLALTDLSCRALGCPAASATFLKLI